MMSRIEERVVTVRQKNATLRAVESFPEDGSGNRPVILFLPSGIKYSVGPYRIFVTYARRLAGEGFLCYRFDPLGIGLSDGEFGGEPLHDLWNRIEEGHFVEDLAHFIGWIRQTHPERKIILCGLCGGAVTAEILALRHEQMVDGIVSINTEVFHSRPAPLPPGAETTTEVNSVMRKYATKLFSWNAWSRLLRMESDIRGILRFTTRFLLQGFRHNKRSLEEYRNINRELIAAFHKIREREISHLMLFSEHSSSWYKFQGSFLPLLLESNYRSPYGEIEIIGGATHEIHSMEHRIVALGQIKRWLDSNFCKPS